MTTNQQQNARNTTSIKDPSEVWIVGLDFSLPLAGKTVASVAWSSSAMNITSQSSIRDIISGGASQSGMIMKHQISGGTPGVLYRVSALVTTTEGEQVLGVLYVLVAIK